MGIIELKEFNVCAVYADDFEASFKFYTDILGMKKSRDMGSGVLLQAGDEMTIYLEGGRKERKSPGEKYPSVALCFSTVEGIKASYGRLKEANVRILGDYMEFNPDFHMFICLDPSGNLVEFAGKP